MQIPDDLRPATSDLTQLIHRAQAGDRLAADALYASLYADLRRLARARLRAGRPNTLLDTCSLVHESYLRFVKNSRLRIEDRVHFMRWAAQVMRSVIVDFARRKLADRRGGNLARATVDVEHVATVSGEEEILCVHQALTRISAIDPRMTQVVEMRYFGGLTEPEIAQALGITEVAMARHGTVRHVDRGDAAHPAGGTHRSRLAGSYAHGVGLRLADEQARMTTSRPMGMHINHVTFDCGDAKALAGFWSTLTGWHLWYDDDPEVVVAPTFPHDVTGLLFIPVPEGKTAKNRVHLDLQPEGMTRDEAVELAMANGATLIGDFRKADGSGWVTLADPEGNEFCIERSKAEVPATPRRFKLGE